MKKLFRAALPCVLFALAVLLCAAVARQRQLALTASAQKPSACRTVVLDAGHGGEDGGAVGVSGTREAALNLEISLRLRDLLRLFGVNVVMIRETDTAVYTDECRTITEKKVSDLKRRAALVSGVPDALLVSIHQNHFPEGKYRGAQVFFARSEGSKARAERMQDALRTYADPANHRACKLAGSVYLMEHASCPAILIECGFLSNYEEEQRLCSEDYQKLLSCVIAATLLESVTQEREAA